MDFSQWPGFSAEKLNAGFKDVINQLQMLRFTPEWCLTDLGEIAADMVKGKLINRSYVVVAVGAELSQTLP
ncbi:hypothetical protein [Cyanobium sp. LEGE 06113]|uniref:hypothetical protein n=1 Tax=Cyanobium sp. LEGE 06113 TaxID=1297573 RepID=UPI0018824CE6|nr:hypothetical protein [Cyanobium sp. LEGE 06113]MBE9155061.1 hypothetical protein [Cyanobium sp. LEGE 06113]